MTDSSDNKNKSFVPIDFNSLGAMKNSILKLSNYYMDYGFYSEGIIPHDKMAVIFYDKGWTTNSLEIICFNAQLHKNENETESWSAQFEGKIYTSDVVQKRKYFSAFIGANTHLVEADHHLQKLGSNPDNNKLTGVYSFVFMSGSKLPSFSQIVGMNTTEVEKFFSFEGFNVPKVINGRLSDDTLVIRGGSNRSKIQD